MWPTIIKVGSKWVLGPKIWFSGKFRRLRCSRWQFQEDLKFCTFYPNHNTQYWPIFSFGIDHLPWFLAAWKSRYFSKITVFLFFLFFFFFSSIFGELYLYKPKFREARIDCCSNLGSCVWVSNISGLPW